VQTEVQKVNEVQTEVQKVNEVQTEVQIEVQKVK
jgi:hypothetical protein